jgi:hypothetical protein
MHGKADGADCWQHDCFRVNDERDARTGAEVLWRPGDAVALSVYAGRLAL